MAILKTINKVLSFLLEIAMLIAIGYWGFQTGGSPALKWVLGIGAPLVVFFLWGLLLTPRKGQHPDSTLVTVVSLCFFYLAALALFLARQTALGIVMVILIAINRALAVIWKQS